MKAQKVRWLFVTIVLSLAALGGGVKSALAITTAGTIIGNSATATYYDENNNDYTTTSNLVQTVVQEVCGVTVTPSATQTIDSVPSSRVYIPVTVKNSGNGQNTYTINADAGSADADYLTDTYLDANANGIIDPAESSVSEITLNIDETVNLILEVQVPSDASNSDTRTIALTVTGSAPGDCSDTTATATINIVDDAVIQANKQVDFDTSTPGGILTYTIKFKNVGTMAAMSRLNLSVDMDNNGVCETNVDGILVSDEIPLGSAYVAESASGQPMNTPFGFPVYSDDGANWYKTEASVSGTISHVGFFMPDDDWNGSAYTNDDTSETVLIVNQQGTFTFQVTVDNPFEESDGSVDNTATIIYRSSTEACSIATNEVSSLIPSSVTADIAIGPRVDTGYDTVEQDDGTNWQDDNVTASAPAGVWVTYTHSAANRDGLNSDTINLSCENAASGWIVEFWNRAGTAKLLDSDGDGSPDVGTVSPHSRMDFTVKVFVPANATTGGSVDIVATSHNEPETQDKSQDVLSSVIIADADIAEKGDAGDNLEDMSDDNTDGTNDQDDILPGETTSLDPGNTATYGIQIVNTGGSSDSFKLNAAISPAIPDTTVRFFTDPNCDESKDDGEEITDTPLLGGTVISANGTYSEPNTTFTVYSLANFVAGDQIILGKGGLSNTHNIVSVDVAASTITIAGDHTGNTIAGALVSETICVVMEIETTPDTAAGSYNVVVTAESGTSSAMDSMDVSLAVNDVCNITLTTGGSDQIPAGGTTTYSHTVTNYSNSDRYVKINLNTTGLKLVYLFIADETTYSVDWKTVGINGEAGETESNDDGELSDGSTAPLGTPFVLLASGESAAFKIRVFAPAGVSQGTVESASIQAVADKDGNFDSGADPEQCVNIAVDVTTVIEGFLQLTKSAATADTDGPNPEIGACSGSADSVIGGPCDTITYKIEYKNIGSMQAEDVVITDAIPDNTTYKTESLKLDTDCDGVGDDDKTDVSGDDTAEFDSDNNLVRFRVGTGASATAGGALAPGAIGCVMFQVTID